MKKLIKYSMLAVGLLYLSGCSSDVETVTKDVMTTAVSEIEQTELGQEYIKTKEKLGESVTALKEVNPVIVEQAGSTIKKLKELDMNIELRKDGIAFSKGQEIEGLIGLTENTQLFIEVDFKRENSDTLMKAIQIVNVFSQGQGGLTIQGVKDMMAKPEEVKVPILNGYVEIEKDEIGIYYERSII